MIIIYYLGIDLGGTNIKAGIVNEKYDILSAYSLKTNAPRPAEEIADDMVFAASAACEKAGLTLNDIQSIGIGSPGMIDVKNGVIEFAGNLHFKEIPLARLIKERTGIKTTIVNDADAAAFGEFVAGAGKGCKSFVAITLGTGVGSGIIVDGKLIEGASNALGELGHMVICVDGIQCTCGRKGCFETYSSATGLIHMSKEAMLKDMNSVMWKLCDNNLSHVSGRTAFEAMRQNDKSGRQVVDKYIKYLATGVTNAINIFAPNILCIGGGICHEGDYLMIPLKKAVRKEQFGGAGKNKTRICRALLGNDAGIIGAAIIPLGGH